MLKRKEPLEVRSVGRGEFRIVASLQIRTSVDKTLVSEYEDVGDGSDEWPFPPIWLARCTVPIRLTTTLTVMEGEMVMADGFHRMGTRYGQLSTIPAKIFEVSTVADIVELSLLANQHGRPISNSEKAAAAQRLIFHDPTVGPTQLARATGYSIRHCQRLISKSTNTPEDNLRPDEKESPRTKGRQKAAAETEVRSEDPPEDFEDFEDFREDESPEVPEVEDDDLGDDSDSDHGDAGQDEPEGNPGALIESVMNFRAEEINDWVVRMRKLFNSFPTDRHFGDDASRVFRDLFNQLIRYARLETPHEVCGQCSGAGCDSERCRGTGYITKRWTA